MTGFQLFLVNREGATYTPETLISLPFGVPDFTHSLYMHYRICQFMDYVYGLLRHFTNILAANKNIYNCFIKVRNAFMCLSKFVSFYFSSFAGLIFGWYLEKNTLMDRFEFES